MRGVEMAVAEQRDRKYSPCQKNAATAKQINNFCCDSLGKLIMPFPSGHNKDLEKLLRNFASCLSWQRSLWSFLVTCHFSKRTKSCLSFHTAASSNTVTRNAVLPQACVCMGVVQKIILVSALGELGPAAASCVTDQDLCMGSRLVKLRLVFKPVTHLDMHLLVLLVQKGKFFSVVLGSELPPVVLALWDHCKAEYRLKANYSNRINWCFQSNPTLSSGNLISKHFA